MIAQGADGGVRRRESRHHDHAHIIIRVSQAREHFQTVHLRQHHVEQHQINLLFLDYLQPSKASRALRTS